MGMFKEFKEFAVKGNAIDLAVGVIIGAAFGKIISSLVSDIFMPVIGVVLGGVNFTLLKLNLKDAVIDPLTGKIIKEGVALTYGNFIQTTLDFIIIAFFIFFIVKMINSMKHKDEAKPAPGPSEEVKLLTEIRDSLKK
jgi:large conductance mechanosensitive channel